MCASLRRLFCCARNIPSELNSMAISPRASIATTPPSPRNAGSSSTRLRARPRRGRGRPKRIREQISWATAARMNISPCPVADTAQERSSAYVPAPMMGNRRCGDSAFPSCRRWTWPRPGGRRCPSATAPTVPTWDMVSADSPASPRRMRSSCAQRSGVKKYALGTNVKPRLSANSSAP